MLKNLSELTTYPFVQDILKGKINKGKIKLFCDNFNAFLKDENFREKFGFENREYTLKECITVIRMIFMSLDDLMASRKENPFAPLIKRISKPEAIGTEYLEKVVGARVNISPNIKLNIIFIRDEMRVINNIPQPEDFYLKKLEDFVTTLKKGDVNIFLSDEYFDPLHGLDPSEEELLNKSKTARFIAKQSTPTYLMIRYYLFTPVRKNIKLNKYGMYYFGEGNIGFRVCNAVNEFPLGTQNFYFIPAMNIPDEVPSPNKGQVIYINDGIKGLR